VIDMSTLATVHDIGRSSADVDAGATWRALLERTLARGLSPPTLTDYQDLSVGGTLSVGGIGGGGFRYGAQVDNVIALEVVTGEGRRMRCSPTPRPMAVRRRARRARAVRRHHARDRPTATGTGSRPAVRPALCRPGQLRLRCAKGRARRAIPTRSAPLRRPLLRIPRAS